MRYLLLLFIAVPIIEMWLLIEVGSRLGALPTIGLVLLTAALGLALLRQQGMDTLLRGHKRLDEGEVPAGEILEGLVLAVCGALLLTPGFVTDVAGFIALVPRIRRALVNRILSRVSVASYRHYEVRQRDRGDREGDDGERRRSSTLEGEYWKED